MAAECRKLTTRGFPTRVRPRARRRGITTLESLLVIPICIIVLLGFIQFSILMIVHHAVFNAAIETARELSKVYQFDITDPNDLDEVEEVVNDILGVHGIMLGDDGLLVIVEDFNGVACLGDAALEPAFCPPQTSIMDEFEIKVTIILLLENTPIPQFLKSFCIDFSGKRFEFCSVARRDC